MADYPLMGYRTLIQRESLADKSAVGNFAALTSASVELSFQLTTEETVQRGAKVASLQSVTDDSGTASVSGTANFNELHLLLASILVGDNGTNAATEASRIASQAAPIAGGTARKFVFAPKLGDFDTPQTFLLETSNKTFGQQTTQAVLKDFNLSAKRPGKVDIGGSFITQQVRSVGDGILPTLVTQATDPAAIGTNVPVQTTCFNIYLSTVSRADLDYKMEKGEKMTRMTSINWKIGDRRTPFYELNCDEPAWATAVEGYTNDLSFSVAANEVSMALLEQVRAGQMCWIRFHAIGPVIDTFTDTDAAAVAAAANAAEAAILRLDATKGVAATAAKTAITTANVVNATSAAAAETAALAAVPPATAAEAQAAEDAVVFFLNNRLQQKYEMMIDTAMYLKAPSAIKEMSKLLGVDFNGVAARDDNFFGTGNPGSTEVTVVNTVGAAVGNDIFGVAI